jgi:hypothetical protein
MTIEEKDNFQNVIIDKTIEIKNESFKVLKTINISQSPELTDDRRKEIIFEEVNKYKKINSFKKMSYNYWDKADKVALLNNQRVSYSEIFTGSYSLTTHYSNIEDDMDCGTEYLYTESSVINKINCVLENSELKNKELIDNINNKKYDSLAIGFNEGVGRWTTIVFVFK